MPRRRSPYQIVQLEKSPLLAPWILPCTVAANHKDLEML
jgi:hypothetical protein